MARRAIWCGYVIDKSNVARHPLLASEERKVDRPPFIVGENKQRRSSAQEARIAVTSRSSTNIRDC